MYILPGLKFFFLNIDSWLVVAKLGSATLRMVPRMVLMTASEFMIFPKRPSPPPRVGSPMLRAVVAACPSQKATAKNSLEPGRQPGTSLSACIWRAGGEVRHSLCSSVLLHALGVWAPGGFHSTGQGDRRKAVTRAQRLW